MTLQQQFDSLVKELHEANNSEADEAGRKRYEKAAYRLAMFCWEHRDGISFEPAKSAVG